MRAATFGCFTPPDVDADVTILAGDIDTEADGVAWAKATISWRPVLYVAGNHEFYSGSKAVQGITAKMKQLVAGSNVSVLFDEVLAVSILAIAE